MSGRDDLAARQFALVSALVAGGPAPDGVDRERVRIQALALLKKRSRAVARHAPEQAAELGPGFWAAFRAYDSARTGPPPDCSHCDSRLFAEFLKSPDGAAVRTRLVAGDITKDTKTRRLRKLLNW